MTDLTDDTLAELERLHEAGTPGPWSVGQATEHLHTDCYRWTECFNLYVEDGRDVTSPCANLGAEDAALIVAMRNHLPALIAAAKRCRELEAERDAALKLLDDSKPNPNTLAWYANKRALFHATYNGGHHDDKCREAFHHGMDTVFNALEGDAKKMIALAKTDALEAQ